MTTEEHLIRFSHEPWTIHEAVAVLHGGDSSDETLRSAVGRFAARLSDRDWQIWLARHLRDEFLSDQALAKFFGVANQTARLGSGQPQLGSGRPPVPAADRVVERHVWLTELRDEHRKAQ